MKPPSVAQTMLKLTSERVGIAEDCRVHVITFGNDGNVDTLVQQVCSAKSGVGISLRKNSGSQFDGWTGFYH